VSRATPGRQPVRNWLPKPWQRVRGAAGPNDLRIHDLRHGFTSIAVSGGDSLYLVGKVLGHRQARTTQRYAHLKDDALRAFANRASETIAAMSKKVPKASFLSPFPADISR
jgi:integrase